MELDNRCPICLDSWEEASYVIPCCHRFCFPCIQRWAESKPECPLCKRRLNSIVHSVRADDDFEEDVVRPPMASPVAVHQAACSPAASSPPAAGRVPRAPVGSLHIDTWAILLWDYPALLEPLLPWLHQALGMMFEDDHLRAAIVEYIIVSCLVLSGPDEDFLVQLLGRFLHDRTAAFVNDLIDAVVRLCSVEARHLLGLEDARADRGQEGSPPPALSPTASRGGSPAPSPAPSGSPARYSTDEPPCTSTAALAGDPSSTRSASVPIPGGQEQPQQEPEEAAPGPSTSSQGGEPRRLRKRRAGSPEASSPPSKMPPHQQHQHNIPGAAETWAGPSAGTCAVPRKRSEGSPQQSRPNDQTK